MVSLARLIRLAVGAWAFLLIVTAPVPALAQQTSVNPTASAVHEQKLLQELRRARTACRA
jgi:formate dehydrogenase subunit gamma